MCALASSDRLPCLCEPQELVLHCHVAKRGGRGFFSDPFSVSNSSIKLIELESFLFLVIVQPTLFYFCWVGNNLPARLLTKFITHSPGSLRQRSPEKAPWAHSSCSLRTLGSGRKSPPEAHSVVAGWMAILVRSQVRVLFQCHSWGRLSSLETSPGTLSSDRYTDTDLPESLKQHNAFLPNPLSMHLQKVPVNVERYIIP